MPRLNQQNLLTINIEDYFQVGPLSSAIPQRFWQRFEKRVERNTLAALDLLDEFDHKAVFFTVGWLADQAPDLLREVVRRGHSIGSKGFFHRPLSQMSLSEFRSDAVRSRLALEKACGDAVVGYRVARGWFGEKDLWALDVLAQEGFQYDSSLLPLGLFRSKPELRGVHQQTGPHGTIWELPISSWKLGPLALPISGGNYVRQLPDAFTENEIDRWVKRSEHPLVFYFHVWELDPDQPRISGVSRLEWLRQYRNLKEMPSRIRKYLSKYEFTSPERYLELKPEKLAALEDPAVPVVLNVAKAEGRPATIVVPCYNEEATLKYLGNTLDRFVAATEGEFKFSFVFVDDGSQDNTLAILRSMFADRPNCKVVQHDRNRGVAAATLTGIRNADTDIACVLDADCSYDPATLLKMIPMLSCGIDLVTASPYHKDGEVLNVPRWRVFLSRGVSILYGTMLTNKIATYTACVRVYRKASVVNLKIENEGYFGITEILVRLDQAGARIVECPAVLESRVLGFSKMKVVRTIWGHLGLLSRLVGDKFNGQFRSKHGVVT